MSSRTPRTAAERLRSEDGIALIVVVLVASVLLGFVVLLLNRGAQSERTAARSEHHDLALAAAEAGVDEAIARIQASGGTFEGSISGQASGGTYSGTVTKEAGERYTVEMAGSVGETQLGRSRTVRVTLEPPEGTFRYAIFSNTSLELKNLDTVEGDIWANDSITLEQNDEITGDVTSAQSWLLMKQGSWIEGTVQTGGFEASAPFAIKLENGAEIREPDGIATASVSDPSTICGNSNYRVVLGTGATIAGNLTTCGQKSGSGTVGGYTPNTYTDAPVPKPLPTFSFNPNNYDPATYHEFTSVPDFQSWLSTNGTNLHGTFWVSDANGSQSNRIDLTGVTVTDDTTIVTDAPIFTNGAEDTVSPEKLFVLVSNYEPPVSSACDVNHDSSECAVHIKNNFEVNADGTCPTATLVYADNGPVAVKNNQDMCGSIYADSVLIKNNQKLVYDPRLESVIGFGDVTYEITRWEELSS